MNYTDLIFAIAVFIMGLIVGGMVSLISVLYVCSDRVEELEKRIREGE